MTFNGMVYAGNVGDEQFSLGVSGRLHNENLVMWDEETESLWNQITGQAIWGDSRGTELPMIPAVFVSLDTWERMHPDSAVLDMSTVRAKTWYYTSEDLANGEARGGRRPGLLELSIGLRHDGDTLAVPMPKLHEEGALNVEVGGVPLAVVWHGEESAALVYDRRVGDRVVEVRNDRDRLFAGADMAWDALTGEPITIERKYPALKRFPYIPTFLRAWRTYYPEGRVVE